MNEDESRCFPFLPEVPILAFLMLLVHTKYMLNQNVPIFFINRSNKRLLEYLYQKKEI